MPLHECCFSCKSSYS